ncbi:hypothetical protein GCM10010218_27650 [Streptomyces mashuensis]|uniref:Uncharacterized protein n=1 Tax=Streptomyces mashuensis TaxID=33904 RepID=A0A919EDG2_9ACTN|nr:hypothetical protein GCM10010218_27650 [Streptomyces mashuensis]
MPLPSTAVSSTARPGPVPMRTSGGAGAGAVTGREPVTLAWSRKGPAAAW